MGAIIVSMVAKHVTTMCSAVLVDEINYCPAMFVPSINTLICSGLLVADVGKWRHLES